MGFIIKRELKKPSENLNDYTLCFVGEKKTGKTSLAAEFPNHFILEFEPGNANHLECFAQDIYNWEEAEQAIIQIKEALPDFCETLIIDDIPSAYEYCCLWARKFLRLSDDEKLGYTGYDITLRKFSDWVRSIQSLPIGKIYTAHTQIKDSETRTGKTISQLEPSWSNQCKKVLDKYLTLTGFVMMDDDGNRELRILGDSFVKANNGFKDHFLVNGVQRSSINLGRSSQEGYQNILKAWKNTKTKPKPTNTKPRKISLADLNK